MQRRIKSYINRWSLLIFLGSLIFLCVMGSTIFSVLGKQKNVVSIPTVSFVVIPAPTVTATTDPMVKSTEESNTETWDGIRIGSIVQIHGTDGAGLRLRTGPGISNGLKFLGMDAELYEVQDGPVDADGYVWWYLVSPYDESRSGWAASEYLSIVTENP